MRFFQNDKIIFNLPNQENPLIGTIKGTKNNQYIISYKNNEASIDQKRILSLVFKANTPVVTLNNNHQEFGSVLEVLDSQDSIHYKVKLKNGEVKVFNFKNVKACLHSFSQFEYKLRFEKHMIH